MKKKTRTHDFEFLKEQFPCTWITILDKIVDLENNDEKKKTCTYLLIIVFDNNDNDVDSRNIMYCIYLFKRAAMNG